MYVDCPECGERVVVEASGRAWCPVCDRFTFDLATPSRRERLDALRSGHLPPMANRGPGGRFRRRDPVER